MKSIKHELEIYFKNKEKQYIKLNTCIKNALKLTKQLINSLKKEKLVSLMKAQARCKALAKTYNLEKYYWEIEKEAAEALIFYYIMKTDKSIDEILKTLIKNGFSHESVLIGTAEAIGELRRAYTSNLILAKQKQADKVFNKALLLIKFLDDFVISNAQIQGFRRMQDVARNNIEVMKNIAIRTKDKFKK